MGPVEILGFVDAAATLALAAWILYLGPRSGLHRALGLFLGLYGINILLFTMDLGLSHDGPGLTLPTRLSDYLRIALPFAAAAAGVEFLYERGARIRRRTRLAWLLGLGVVALTLEALFLLNHDLLSTPDGTAGPLALFTYARPLAAALVACLLLASPRPADAGTVRVAAAAFLMEGAYASATILRGAVELARQGIPLNGYDVLGLFVVPALAVVAALAGVGLAWRRDRVLGIRYLSVVGAALATALLVSSLERLAAANGGRAFGIQFGAGNLHLSFAMEFVWGLAATGTLVYAVLRCRFLRAELAARRFFKGGIVAASLTAVFFTVGQVLESKFNPDGVVLNVVAGAVVAAALWPLQRGATVIAQRVMSQVHDTPEYRKSRSQEIYAQAARVAWLDGRITPAEARALKRLGAELGLSANQIDGIEARARTGRAASSRSASAL